MSLYSDYIKETTSDLVLESDRGFAVYRYLPDKAVVYITHIHVSKEFRKEGLASAMADTIANEAKSKGCKEMWGSVVPSQKGSTASLQVLVGYGMRLDSSTNDFILFKKEI